MPQFCPKPAPQSVTAPQAPGRHLEQACQLLAVPMGLPGALTSSWCGFQPAGTHRGECPGQGGGRKGCTARHVVPASLPLLPFYMQRSSERGGHLPKVTGLCQQSQGWNWALWKASLSSGLSRSCSLRPGIASRPLPSSHHSPAVLQGKFYPGLSSQSFWLPALEPLAHFN